MLAGAALLRTPSPTRQPSVQASVAAGTAASEGRGEVPGPLGTLPQHVLSEWDDTFPAALPATAARSEGPTGIDGAEGDVGTAAAARPAASPAPAALLAAPSHSAREAGLLDAINRERAAAGFVPLTPSAALLAVARARSSDMAAKGYFAHFGPNGESAYALLLASGARFGAGGENLAKVGGDDVRSVAVAIDALMRSAGHRANILDGRYRAIGVGAVTDGAGASVFTMIFTD